jgi:hypothetical protein
MQLSRADGANRFGLTDAGIAVTSIRVQGGVMADNEIPTDVIAETDNYSVWVSEEPDGEVTYHIELGLATIHFFEEEWKEFLELLRSLPQSR